MLTPAAKYFCPIEPLGEDLAFTFVMLVSAIVVLRIGSCLLFELSTIDTAESSMVSPNSQWAAREWRMI
jgi:hypothetical protein